MADHPGKEALRRMVETALFDTDPILSGVKWIQQVAAYVAELEAQVAAVEEWTHRMGVELRPSGPDTYGEGVRDSKAKVARLLARTAPKEQS